LKRKQGIVTETINILKSKIEEKVRRKVGLQIEKTKYLEEIEIKNSLVFSITEGKEGIQY
jgi:hypothetical protein